MKKKKKDEEKKRPIPEMLTPERYDLISDMEAVSSTDQTGLVAFAPVTEEQYANYNEIRHFKPEYSE